jgi:hypothetical protein
LPRAFWCERRRALLLQLFGTVVVLGWVPGNSVKLAVMAVFWLVGFGSLSAAEIAGGAVVCLLFVAMDEGALRQGVFRFLQPDFAGLPIYEFFIWGFYVVHALRFVGCERGERFRPVSLALAAVFAACFTTITDPEMLAVAAGAVVAVSLVLLRRSGDIASAIYMIGMGALVEYVGVGTGQWVYPDAPSGGVPLWSFMMWTGIGLFSRAVLGPFVQQPTATGSL